MAVRYSQRAHWEEEITRLLRMIRENPMGWPWHWNIGPLEVHVGIAIATLKSPDTYIVRATRRGKGRHNRPLPNWEHCADLLDLRVWITRKLELDQ